MRRTLKRTLPALAVLGLLAGGLALGAGNAGAAPPKTYTSTASPARLVPSANQRVSITLRNTTRNDILFDAVNLVVPPGLTVANPTVTTGTGSGTVAYDAATRTLQLRTLAVGTTTANNTAVVAFTITNTVPADCGTYTVSSDVRQSNNFNGTLNKFALTGSEATFGAPCNSASVTCTANDASTCTTGTIYSASGGQAVVTVQDRDTISATLTASLAAATYQCPEYTATSDQLDFGITITNGATTSGLTKTVTFARPVTDTRAAWQYQVCFTAPYDFPAQLPSQLLQDFNTGDFGGNTTFDGSEYRGLLLPCSAGYGVPCITSRAIAGGRVEVGVSTAVADPKIRY